MSQHMDRARDRTTWGRTRAVRYPDFDYRSDAIIHLTVCASSGAPFAAHAVAQCVSEAVGFRCRPLAYRLFGYCLMPDHLHVLLSPAASRVAISTWLRQFKSFTGHEYVKRGGTPPLWQRSAHDHVCRKGETAEAMLAYIVRNPERAALVEDWRDWPWTRTFIEI